MGDALYLNSLTLDKLKKMKRIKLIILAALFASACGQTGSDNPTGQGTGNADQRFDSYKAQLIENLWKIFPGWASNVGYHKYDSILIVQTDESRGKENAFLQSNLDSLKAHDLNKLSANNKTDYYLIENQMKGILWANQSCKSYEWNPSDYNVVSGIAELLNGNYDKLDIRLTGIYGRLKNVPAYYEAAKKYIKNPTKEHTQLGAEQNLNSVSIIEKDLADSVRRSGLDEATKKDFEIRINNSVKAIKDYAKWLKAMKNDHPRSFHLGKELYESKFEFDIQSRYTAEEIYQRAIKRKDEIHTKMAEISKHLWPKYMGKEAMPTKELELTRKMIDKISVKHASRDSFQIVIEKQIPELAEFIKQKENYLQLGAFLQQKRDHFLAMMQQTKFKALPSYGSYFQL